jgi:hypothetical protein
VDVAAINVDVMHRGLIAAPSRLSRSVGTNVASAWRNDAMLARLASILATLRRQNQEADPREFRPQFSG